MAPHRVDRTASGLARLLRWLAGWREREVLRRQLAAMSVRDFGDIAVPPALIREERARWPWQAANRGWAALSRDEGVANGEGSAAVGRPPIAERSALPTGNDLTVLGEQRLRRSAARR